MIFANLARYNRIVNERLYEVCSHLPDGEYRRERFGSFGSIHRTLNHILLGDRIWMGRFETRKTTNTPPLASILYDEFAALRAARAQEDARIEAFMAAVEDTGRDIVYYNSAGVLCRDSMTVAMLHMFNHQTHHRGQIHVMLSHAGVQPPSLDMHRALNPV